MWSKMRSTWGLAGGEFRQKTRGHSGSGDSAGKGKPVHRSGAGRNKAWPGGRIERWALPGAECHFQAYDGEEHPVVLINFMQKQQAVRVPVSAIRP